jgi:hypothetical protein
MSERITNYSVGRRWRCQRGASISFDFVILGPGDRPGTKKCRLEPLPGEELRVGTVRVESLKGTISNYTTSHLRRVATLQPISLDDIARSI